MEVNELFELFRESGNIAEFLRRSNHQIKPEQVAKVLEFVEENVRQPMKQLFKWLGEGKTVQQFLDCKAHTTQEQVDDALERVQRSLVAR